MSQESNDGDDIHQMLHDSFGIPDLAGSNRDIQNEVSLNESSSSEPPNDEPNEEARKFYKLLKEADTPLYPGSTKSSKLSFLIRLVHVKCLSGGSNNSFDLFACTHNLLSLLNKVFSTHSFYFELWTVKWSRDCAWIVMNMETKRKHGFEAPKLF
ncbi:hypothetical protein ACHQM5_004054 [Ranunculus cassubicifolius]